MIDSSECGSEKWRSRPSLSVALPPKTGLVNVPPICALSAARAAAAKIAEESLQDAEVRVARGLDVNRLVLQAEPAVERELRSLTRETEAADLEDVPIERQLDRPIVLHAIVEQFKVELLDIGDDRELVLIGELADDAHRAAAIAVVNGDSRGTKNRTYGSSDVSPNRTVSSASISGVSAIRPSTFMSRRGEPTSRSSASRSPRRFSLPDNMTDAFVAGEEIVDDELDVVARLVERTDASGVELQAARQRRPRKGDAGQRLDRDARAVGVERVVAVPADIRGAGDAACALLDVDVVETDTRAFEAQR